jgi:hypothetical protein
MNMIFKTMTGKALLEIIASSWRGHPAAVGGEIFDSSPRQGRRRGLDGNPATVGGEDLTALPRLSNL